MRWKWCFVFILILAFSFCAEKQEKEIWPTGGWEKSSPEKQGMDVQLLSDLDAKMASGDHGYIDGFIVIRNGYLVYEKFYENDYVKINEGKDPTDWLYNYFDPDWHPFYKGTRLHTLQSVTKSVTSANIGIAIGKGAISGVDVKIVDIFADAAIENLDDWKKQMTLEDVLTMRTGIDWDESLPYTDANNTCTQLEASNDWFQFVISRPLEAEPGTVFEYNSGASQLLSSVIKKTTGEYVDKYAEKYLFGPLGISKYHWKITPTGLPDTEGGLYLEPYDLAKIGYLYMHDGVWNGERILPEGWVKATVAPHVADIAPANDQDNRAYGYQWWLLPYTPQSKEYVYACLGYGGQYLLVSSKHNLIAVFNGWNIYEKPRLPLTVFFDFVVKAVVDAN